MDVQVDLGFDEPMVSIEEVRACLQRLADAVDEFANEVTNE